MCLTLDCRFVFLHLVYPLCCLWIVVLFFFILCTPYVASFSGLSFCFSSSCVPPMLPLDCRFVCLHLVYPLCCLWIVVLFVFILCTPYVASFSGLSFCFSSSQTCICPVSCVSYVASFSGLSFFITPSVFSNIDLSCVLCILCCQFLLIVLLHCPFGII